MTNSAIPNANLGPPALPLVPPPGVIPPGESLAWLAANDKQMYESTLKQIREEEDDHIKEQCLAYMDALFVHREPSREKRLAGYLMRTPQGWLLQRFLIPGPSYIPNFTDDFRDFTALVKAAVEGDFDKTLPGARQQAPAGYGQLQATLSAGAA